MYKIFFFACDVVGRWRIDSVYVFMQTIPPYTGQYFTFYPFACLLRIQLIAGNKTKRARMLGLCGIIYVLRLALWFCLQNEKQINLFPFLVSNYGKMTDIKEYHCVKIN